jgi:secreted Zn-dependent insulinase-like peptidase
MKSFRNGSNWQCVVCHNGMTVLALAKPQYYSAHIRLVVKYGSLHNRFIDPFSSATVVQPEGVAHFLEHALFPSEGNDAYVQLAEFGADLQASTYIDRTTFYSTTVGNVMDTVGFLLELAFRSDITEDRIQLEKHVIRNEMLMSHADPAELARQNMLNALFWYHPVKKDVKGTVESLSQITLDDVRTAHSMFYVPQNCWLLVAGDVHIHDLVERAEQMVSGKPCAPAAELPAWREPPNAVQAFSLAEVGLNQAYVHVGYKHVHAGMNSSALFQEELVIRICAVMLEHELYKLLVGLELAGDDGSADAIRVNYCRAADAGYLEIAALTDSWERFREVVMQAVTRVRETQWSEALADEFKRLWLLRYWKEANDLCVLTYYMEKWWTTLGEFDLERTLKNISARHLRDGIERLLVPENMAVSIVC